MTALKIIMYGTHFLVSLLLIILVVSQTNRSEGLGVVGGSSSTPTRGRAGLDEQLNTYTKWVAIAFMVLSALLYILALKYHWV